MEKGWSERKKGCSEFGKRKKGCSGSGYKVGESKENDTKRNWYGSVSGKRKKALIRHLKTLTAREVGVFDIYDRKSDPNGPRREDLICYAELAIASYYKTNAEESQRYTVVDIIRSEKHCVRGFIVLMEFTAKPHNQDDAIIFRASLLEKCNGIDDAQVCFIGPISEEEAASKPLKDTPRGP